MIEKENIPVEINILNIESYPWHTHPNMHIIYVFSGEIELKLSFAHYTLKENHIHFIHSEDMHGFKSITERSTILLLTFDMDYFSDLFPNLENQMFSTRSLNHDAFYTNQTVLRKQIFTLVLRAWELNDSDQYGQILTDAAIDIFKTLYRDFRNFKIGDDKLLNHYAAHDMFQIDRIARIISYIYANYNYKINLKTIADNENINTYYLSHLFQKFVGINFRDFLNMTRIEMSEHELLMTDKAISKIALDMGFSNYNYYVNTFEKWFGMHPKDYRKRFYKETVREKEPAYEIIPLAGIIPQIKKELTKLNSFDIYQEEEPHVDIDLSLSFEKDSNNTSLNETFYYNLIKNLPDISLFISKGPDPAEVYDKYYPHKYCIDLLNSAVSNNDFSLPHLQVTDSIKNQNGIFAINGLKKPLYYLCLFWSQLYAKFFKTGHGHIVTRGHDGYSIILFNDSTFFDLDITINFTDIEENHKLTQRVLSPSDSCIDYWFQLDFQKDISSEDFKFIEQMTVPKTSFMIIPETGSYSHSLSLKPLEIIHIKFNRQ